MPPILDLQNTGNMPLELLMEKTKAMLLKIISTRYEEDTSEAAKNALALFKRLDTLRLSSVLLLLAKETQATLDTEEDRAQENKIRDLIRWWFTRKFSDLALPDYQHNPFHSARIYSALKACHHLRTVRHAIPSLENNPRIKELFHWWDEHPDNLSFEFLVEETKTSLLNLINTPYEESGSEAAQNAYTTFNALDCPPTSDALIFLAREAPIKSDEETAEEDKIRKLIHWGFTQKFLSFTRCDYRNNPLKAIWVHSRLKACHLSAIRDAIPSLLNNPQINELFRWWDQQQHQIIPSLKTHIKHVLMPLTTFHFKSDEAAYNKIESFNHSPVNTYLLSILATPPFIPLYEWWTEKKHLAQKTVEAVYIKNLNLKQPLSLEQKGAADFTFGAARVPEIAPLRKTLLLRSGQHIFSMEKIQQCFRHILSQTDRLTHIMRELSFPEEIINDTHQKIHAIFSTIHKENQDFSLVIDATNAVLEANRKKIKEKLDHAARVCRLLAASYTPAKVNESLVLAHQKAKEQNDKLRTQLQTLTRENNLLSNHFNAYKKWSALRQGLLRHTLSLVKKTDFNHVLYLLKEDGNIKQFLYHSYFQHWLSEVSLTRLGKTPDSANTSDQLIKLMIVNARTDANTLLLESIRSLYNTIKMHPGYLLLEQLTLEETVSDYELSERKRTFEEILPRMTELIDWQLDSSSLTPLQTSDLSSLKTLLKKVEGARKIQAHTLLPHQKNDDETLLLNTLFDHHQDIASKITQEVDKVVDSQKDPKSKSFQLTPFLETIISKLFFAFHQVNWKEIIIDRILPPNETIETHSPEPESESSALDLLSLDGTASEASSTAYDLSSATSSADAEDTQSETSNASTLSSTSSSANSSCSYKSTVITSIVRRDEPNLAEIFPYHNREDYFFKRYPIMMCEHLYERVLELALSVGKLGCQDLATPLLIYAFFLLETIDALMTNETLEQAQREEFLTRDASRYSFFKNDPRALLKQAKSDLIAQIREKTHFPLKNPSLELGPTIMRAQDKAASLTR